MLLCVLYYLFLKGEEELDVICVVVYGDINLLIVLLVVNEFGL